VNAAGRRYAAPVKAERAPILDNVVGAVLPVTKGGHLSAFPCGYLCAGHIEVRPVLGGLHHQYVRI
jgi:hypothetical protein